MREPFAGTQRYSIRRRIGAGGMGVVYEAFDAERGRTVALKTLTRVDPAAIYRLKQEFRSLADVVHGNLVALYDLVSEDDSWFFTMEYVPGKSFIEHVRGAPAEGDLQPAARREAPGLQTLQSPGAVAPLPGDAPEHRAPDPARPGPPPAIARWQPDLTRLRAALAQLAEGVRAIHAAGKLHRDLKPNNVLVTAEGRVVVLDFGLARAHDDGGLERSLEDALVVGTPAYMAPEQAAGEPATAASDWYAVGVMLFEALTGQLPFSGSVREVLAQKQHVEPVAPGRVVGGVPPDLDRLCQALLRRDPSLRPGFGDVAARLRLGPVVVVPSHRASIPATTAPESTPPFVGRARELAALRGALADTRQGRPVMVSVRGAAGTGKTLLLDRFLEQLRAEGSAVVLTGRCYQRESVPYKAFDAVIDALSRHLRRLPAAEVEALLPRNVGDLVRLFPVLERVEAVQRAPHCGVTTNDEEPRRRAFAAIKELLGRIADRRPLAIVVDDLHWGDLDSADLLTELLRAPDAPAMLFVAGFRGDLMENSPMLACVEEPAAPPTQAQRRMLELGALGLESGIGLALDLLGACDDAAWTLAKAIAREGRGNPLFIAELSRHFGALGNDEAPLDRRAHVGVTLEEALAARVAKLPEPEQRLLTVLAVAGAPLEQEILARVAGLAGDPRLAVANLRRQRLAESSRRLGYEVAEIAHEPLRDVLLGRLTPPQTRELHERIAVELAATGRSEPETLTRHFADAGRRELAAEHAVRAAERAQQSLAFARAAHLFELALALRDPDDPERWHLLGSLAEALARTGRTDDAVERYLEAARGAPTPDSARLTRKAAELKFQGDRVEGLFHGSARGDASLFDGIRREELHAFLTESEIVTGQAGEILVEAAERADCFYVVLSGAVALEHGRGASAQVGEGAIVGEVPFLLGAPRPSRVRAASDDARLLAINQRSLEGLSETNPRLALRLVANLARVVCAKAAGVQRQALGEPERRPG